jgi:hypothetical protein
MVMYTIVAYPSSAKVIPLYYFAAFFAYIQATGKTLSPKVYLFDETVFYVGRTLTFLINYTANSVYIYHNYLKGFGGTNKNPHPRHLGGGC